VQAKLRIAIVVDGRYHAYDAARALLELGHDVVLFTNLPAFIGRRFGIGAQHLHGDVLHGVLKRVAARLGLGARFEAQLSSLFGRRARKAVRRWAAREGAFDVVHIFSGVAEEILLDAGITGLKTLLRGSSHIITQHDLLQAEAQRMQQPIEQPSSWMIARELREYALCDRVVVMSSFAQRSFITQHFAPERLLVCPAGAHVGDFCAPPAIRSARAERVARGDRLTVLLVGTLSARKGVFDLVEVVLALSAQMHFRFVGTVAPDAEACLARMAGKIELIPRVAQHELPALYAGGDIFLLHSIEDGFAVVLVQALMAGLAVLCSENCAASDVVDDGKTGAVVPAHAPERVIKQLLHWHQERSALSTLLGNLDTPQRDFSWDAAMQEFVVKHRGALATDRGVAPK
jgi:glycosyltransferase involved in cell wall biosynthesis